LQIFICEDDRTQRERLENTVNQQILSDEINAGISLSTDNPAALLEYLQSHQVQSGLYFLDVDLQCDMNGIELGGIIRKTDIYATIVFITTHSEMTPLVFTHKVEAVDYISKDQPPAEIEMRIGDSMKIAYKRFLDDKPTNIKYYSINVGKQTLNIPYDKIVYFESSVNQRNKLVLHTEDSILSFRGHISDIAKLGLPFSMCHQSYVVNVNNIKTLDKVNRQLEMINGTTITVSKRRLAEIVYHFYERH